MRTMSHENLVRLGNNQTYSVNQRYFNNAVNYNILSNERYADLFFYTHMERRSNKWLTESSDMVTRILNLGEERLKYDRHGNILEHGGSSDESSEEKEEFNFNTSEQAMMILRSKTISAGTQEQLSFKEKLA